MSAGGKMTITKNLWTMGR